MLAETTRSLRRMATGRDDRLPEHLTAFDDRPPPVAPGDADEGEAAIGADVQLVDQVRGIAPGGEPLDGHIPWGVTFAAIGDLDPHPVLVEGSESGQRALGVRGRFDHGVSTPLALEPLEIDVGEREVEDGRSTGLLPAQARIGLGDKISIRPGARPVRVSLDEAHRPVSDEAQPSPVAREATVTEGMATLPPWRRSESTMAMRSSIPTKAPLM